MQILNQILKFCKISQNFHILNWKPQINNVCMPHRQQLENEYVV